jgi:nicotinamidase-related amidase
MRIRTERFTLGNRRRIIPKIRELREKVRRAGGRVIHTQSVRSPDALEFTVFKNTVRKLEGSWGVELIEELKPADDEPLIVKRTMIASIRPKWMLCWRALKCVQAKVA